MTMRKRPVHKTIRLRPVRRHGRGGLLSV